MDKKYLYKQATLEVKQLGDNGSFEAYVAVFNNKDFGNDIIDPKAFDDVDTSKYYPLLADHETKTVIGKFRVMPDEYGLKMVDAKFNLMRDEETGNFLVPLAAEKYANLKNGDIDGFSIGFIPKDCDYKELDGERCRVINKAQIMEGSVVTFPMNDKARLLDIKTVNPRLEYPLAPRDTKWDSTQAEKRVKEYTESKEEPAATYQRYFMYFDAGRSKFFDAYKLPFVDIINDEPHIVPKAIFAIAAVLEGARGGLQIPLRDRAKIKEIVNNQYKRMSKEFDDESLVSPLVSKSLEEFDALKDVESVLRESGFSSKEAKTLISKVKELSSRDEQKAKDEEKQERDAVEESLSALKNSLQENELKQSLTNLKQLLITT